MKFYRNNLAVHLSFYFFIHKQVLGGFELFIVMFRKLKKHIGDGRPINYKCLGHYLSEKIS